MSQQRDPNRLRIGVQKSGRLSDGSFELLQRCGINIPDNKRNKTRLFYHSDNFPIDVLLVRDDDIPNLVLDGVCDLGIVGTNVLQEKALGLNRVSFKNLFASVQKLNFAKCKLSIALPEAEKYTRPECLHNKRIATSYPNILQQFCVENNVEIQISMLSGSVEIAPRLNLADAVCDIVSTGATLEANGLREVVSIFESEAVLIQTVSQLTATQCDIVEKLKSRIEGVQKAQGSKYILFHAPKENIDAITQLIPGCESPTVMPLMEESKKVAVHAVCRENIFWETMESLKSYGASAILVLPVEKML